MVEAKEKRGGKKLGGGEVSSGSETVHWYGSKHIIGVV